MKKYLTFFYLAGWPGILLIGYDIVQLVFARSNDSGGIDIVAIIFALYSILCLFYAFLDYRKNKKVFNQVIWNSPLAFFILYTLFGIVSCLWSDNIAITAFRALECLGMTMLIICVYKNLTKYRNFDFVYKWTMLYVVVNSFLKGLYAVLNQGIVALIPGNAFWSIMQFIAPLYFFLFFLHSKKTWFKFFILFSAILAKSTVGYIAIAGGSIGLFLGDKKAKKWGVAFLIVALISICTLGVDGFLNATVSSEHDVTNLEDSSGRNEIWEIGMWAYEQSPVYGHGFFYYENYVTKLMKGSYAIGMHNSYMSALVGEGLIGLILFSIFMIGMCFNCISSRIPQQYKSATIALMAAIIVETMGNPSLGFRVYGCWMPSMVGVILIIFVVKYGRAFSTTISQELIPKI